VLAMVDVKYVAYLQQFSVFMLILLWYNVFHQVGGNTTECDAVPSNIEHPAINVSQVRLMRSHLKIVDFECLWTIVSECS